MSSALLLNFSCSLFVSYDVDFIELTKMEYSVKELCEKISTYGLFFDFQLSW